MSSKASLVSMSLLGLVACVTPRSEIKPEPVKHEVQYEEAGPKECAVQDFPESVDLPEGSKNMGTVSVPREGNDEDTYAALRKAVCEKGGDAMSSMRWLHTIGKKDGPPTDLECTAWLLP
jgi:hypothetical protein